MHLRQHQTVISEAESNSTILEFELELKLDEEDLLFIAKPGPEQYTAKYSHPSEKGHRAISEWVDKVIRRDLL